MENYSIWVVTIVIHFPVIEHEWTTGVVSFLPNYVKYIDDNVTIYKGKSVPKRMKDGLVFF